MSAETEFDNIAQDMDRIYDRLHALAKTDPELGRLIPDENVIAAVNEDGISYQQILARVLAGYADRDALAVRAYDIRAGADGRKRRHYLPEYRKITYGHMKSCIEAIASAWRHHPRHRLNPGEFITYISFSGAEMLMMDYAAVFAQAVSVPIQANLPRPDGMTIFGDTDPAVMVASIDNLELAVDYALIQPSIRSLLVIDADEADDDDRDQIKAARSRLADDGDRVALATFAELVEYGRAFEWEPLPRPAEGDRALSMVMYTSGSTGTPKGAMIHEGMHFQFWRLRRHQPTITMAYAPMNHFAGRTMINQALANGGTCYMTLRSDLSTLLEDIRLARPTNIVLIPRMVEQIYQTYRSEVQRRVSAGVDRAEAEKAVRDDMRYTYLGDRLCGGGTGSAPTSYEARQFVRECFDIPFFEGYGSTEASGNITTFGNRIIRDIVIDYKLADVPELGYYATDKPYPRGELLVKTHLMIQGYWKRPDATAQIFDEDGYLRTGDVMEERGPDHVVWIDRRNNVIKLSQAEFVAIGPLETTYLGNSKLINQIFVYGNGLRSYLLAVVVPDLDVARARHEGEPSMEDLRKMVLADLQEAARIAGLKSFEVPRDVLVELEPFSLENGLLTSVRKPARANLKRHYQDRLEAMYKEMDRKQEEELDALRAEGSGLSTAQRVAGAFKANLGLEAVDPDGGESFRDLGGDSLGAVSLSILLEEIFGVTVPASIILDPNGTAQRLAQYVDRARAGGANAPTFATVHGSDATVVKAADLTPDAFFDPAAIESFEAAAAPSDTIRTVLLTGATGFLGRFLCLSWMERLSAVGGKVICVIRGTDDADARARLDEVIGTVDKDLADHFRALASKHLEVIAGDLAAPKLGLADEEFDRLTREVDKIVHPGALVNHRLSYANLFEPNVVGTAELIRLALTGRQKPFDYVSTVGVPYVSPGLIHESEDLDVRVGAPEYALNDEYANGYCGSKWAGEVLLRAAHEQFGLPVNVFRPNMIMPHAHYVGQINIPDMFTRLLLSVVLTGIAPRSFYIPGADGEPQKAHYDGLPVDFLARSLQELGEISRLGFETFNTVNIHHDDGVSLDSVMGWIDSAGYPVELMDDHAEWIRRIGDKLRNLPDEQRQNSSLNILGAFAEPYDPDMKPVQNVKFEQVIGSLAAGPEVPHLTEAFIHKYLNDMVVLGLIPAPTGERRQKEAESAELV